MRNKAETLTLAFCIALLPPIWAVAAPYVGVTTGAVALICAGLCAANGDKAADAPRISAGFLLGDFWAWLALVVMDKMTLNPDFEVFITLFVMGGLAVILSGFFPKWIFCPAWLCGWAIGLTIMTPVGLAGGPSPVRAVPFEERNLFLKGEDKDYCQIGYGVAEDGTAFVCNETYMPGVTTEMMDWWFPWHSVGSDLRYKVWDPEDHYFARADNCAYVCDPAVPMREKTWGVSHYIIEDVGPGPEFLKLCFKSPADFGYEDPDTAHSQSLVCAIGEGGCPAAMTHVWAPYKDGILFRSRFWIGYALAEGQFRKILPEGAKVPDIVPKGLFAHNIKEFTNLAALLPELYQEFGAQPL